MIDCYSQCAAIPWYQFQKRELCTKQCDLEAYQIQNDEIQESFQMESAQTSTLYSWLFPTLIIIVVLLVVAKWQKWI